MLHSRITLLRFKFLVFQNCAYLHTMSGAPSAVSPSQLLALAEVERLERALKELGRAS